MRPGDSRHVSSVAGPGIRPMQQVETVDRISPVDGWNMKRLIVSITSP